jgi:hypothetical protein
VKLPNAVATVAVVVCAIMLIVLVHSRQELALVRAQAAALKATKNDLSQRVADLDAKAIDPAILRRLETDQRETIKLRGEVAKLRTAVSDAETKAKTNQANATRAVSGSELELEPATTNRFARVHERKLTVNVAPGHGVVFGGWQVAPGKQAFAVAVPTTSADSPGQVVVQTKWLEITDEALGKLDAKLLVRAAGQQATVDPDELQAFLKSVEVTPGMSILSSPTVTTLSGRQARISVSESRTVPDGSVVEFGPTVDLIPTLGADGNVEMAVNAKLTVPTEELTAAKQ